MNALAKPTLAQAIHRSADTFRETIEPQQFPDLLTEKRPYVNTEIAAHWVARRPQTLRGWACFGNGPLHPIRIHGRLAWSVRAIKSLLGVEVA